MSVQEIAGTKVLVAEAAGPPITTGQDVLDLIGTVYYDEVGWIVVPVDRLTDDFFDLSTGVAGEIVQKFVQYSHHLAVTGRLPAASKPFADFVRECNEGRQTWFVADLSEFERRLSGS